MGEMYIVKYSGGGYDDNFIRDIFITADETTAIAYVNKFNNVLDKCKTHYKQFEGENGWIRDDTSDTQFERWFTYKEIRKCYYEPIPVR